jgi:hypothetical protein
MKDTPERDAYADRGEKEHAGEPEQWRSAVLSCGQGRRGTDEGEEGDDAAVPGDIDAWVWEPVCPTPTIELLI